MKTVYKHLDNDGNVFYIGCGSVSRAFNKISRTDKWKEKAKNGYTIEVVSIMPKQSARDLERKLIHEYGLENLVNGCNVWNEEEKKLYTNRKNLKKSVDMPITLYNEIKELADEKSISWNAMCRILLKDHLDFLEAQKVKK